MNDSNMIVTNELDKKLVTPYKADLDEQEDQTPEETLRIHKGNMLESDLKAESFIAGYRPALN